MSTFPRWFLRAAGHHPGRERLLAEASRAAERHLVQRDLAADEVRFLRRMTQVARASNIVLGMTRTGTPYRIPLQDAVSLPGWVTGGTGSGKSRFCASFVEAAIRRVAVGEPISVIGSDGKGESADLWLRSVAAVAGELDDAKRARLLSRVRVLRFFDEQFLPSWPILAPVSGVSIATQADAVAEVLTEVVADASVGPRQRSTLSAVLALAIEAGVPLAALPWLLSAPSEIAALASRSSLPSVRLDLSRFEREPQGSIDGLLARLGIVLRIPSLKAVFSGTGALDFMGCFEPGSVTVLDFGGAPLGSHAAVRAIGSLAVSALTNAAFDPRRKITGKTLIIIDEPQMFLTSVSIGCFERLVTLGRSFGAGGVVFVHQGATQLPQEFQTALNTNCVWRALGRSAAADATAASEWLPITRTVPRPRVPGATRTTASRFLNDGEERRFRIGEIGRLPVRHFLVADRRLDTHARIVEAPSYDPPAWNAIPSNVEDAVRRGAVGVPRAELEARVREIEEQAAARLNDVLNAESSEPRRRGRTPATPDVVGRRGRGGEVP